MISSEGAQTYPEPIVGALVFDSQGSLLLVKSHKWRDLYGLPGGHVELGETMKDAVRREVEEETGLYVDQVRFLCFQEMVFDDTFWTKSHFVFFRFCLQVRRDRRELECRGRGIPLVAAGAGVGANDRRIYQGGDREVPRSSR